MKVIELKHPYQKDQIINEPIVLVLGYFDGVHLGHRHVISQAREIALEKKLPLVVMTFDRHPKILYNKIEPEDVRYLTLNQRKMELFVECGVDYCYMIEFSAAFGHQSPQAFADNYIAGLHAETVVAGADYTYGPKELANMETLPIHAKGRFNVVQVPELQISGHKIGSRYIIENILEGHMDIANEQLGYVFEIQGEVVHGFKRGRELGYPTANVKVDPAQLLPRIGVYISEVEVDGQWYQAMTSVGYNVTFDSPGEKKIYVETYLLDFDQMIYGKIIRVKWLKYLRDEMKFNGFEGLIQQLDADLVNTRAYFAS